MGFGCFFKIIFIFFFRDVSDCNKHFRKKKVFCRRENKKKFRFYLFLMRDRHANRQYCQTADIALESARRLRAERGGQEGGRGQNSLECKRVKKKNPKRLPWQQHERDGPIDRRVTGSPVPTLGPNMASFSLCPPCPPAPSPSSLDLEANWMHFRCKLTPFARI